MKSGEKGLHKFWEIPKRYVNRNNGVSLYELFYDLIVAVALGSIVHSFYDSIHFKHTHDSSYNKAFTWDITFDIIQTLTILFIWRITTLHFIKYEIDNLRQRFIMFLQMTGFMLIVAGAYGLHNILDIKSLSFILLIIGYSIVIFLNLWEPFILWIKSEDKWIKKELKIEIISALLILLFFVGWFVPFLILSDGIFAWSISISFWILNLLTMFISGWFTSRPRIKSNTPNINVNLIQERYSILFILFMSEALISTISDIGIQVSKGELKSIVYLLVIFSTIYSIWWYYKDVFNFTNIINRPNKIFIYTFSMCFIFLGITLMISGLELFVAEKKYQVESGYFIATGAFIWHLFGAITWYTLHDYKISINFTFPKWVRKWVIYTSPISFWLYGWTIFVFPELYFWINFGVVLLYLILVILTFVNVNINTKNNLKQFHKDVESFDEEDIQWIRKNIKSKIDVEHHINYKKKYGENLNKYSFCINHTKKA